jgi:hypothetical protein
MYTWSTHLGAVGAVAAGADVGLKLAAIFSGDGLSWYEYPVAQLLVYSRFRDHHRVPVLAGCRGVIHPLQVTCGRWGPSGESVSSKSK